MTISYATHHKSGASYKSRALQHYASIHENYNGNHINILSESVSEVLGSEASFLELKEELLEGTDDKVRQQLDTLLENARVEMLQESSISGTNPITALSLPMLRVGFPKIAVREGLPTEPVQQPSFKVTIKRPYVMSKDGEKQYLPQALKGSDMYGLPQLETDPIAATDGFIANYDLLSPISKNYKLGDEIDPRFTVAKVKVTIGAVDVVRDVNFELDVNTNTVSGEIFNDARTESATIIGSVNRAKGLLSLTAIGGTLLEASIIGFVSSEANNSATQIGFDIDGIDCVIGTAQPVESPINIQQMVDTMNMYSVDATLSHVETMTTFLAQNTDREGVNFIKSVFQREVQNKITESFDVTPPSNFTHGNAAWREEIKLKIDRIVSRMQTEVDIYSGHTVLFCHPLDAQVISNVKWIYSMTEQVNDVEVTYKVGQYVSGTTSYMVLQSPYFPQGQVPVVYIPSDEEHKSLVYYPYSMHTIRGMVSSSANAANLPSIQMIKRHLFKAFTPMVAMLTIVNNEIK